MESIKCTEKASLQYVEKGIWFCRKYGVPLGEVLKDNKGAEVTLALICR